MNICFLIGKIISEIKFDFIIDNNSSLGKEKISIVRFKISLLDKTEINIIGYNKIADWCYLKLNIGDNIFLEGFIEFGKIEIREVWLL